MEHEMRVSGNQADIVVSCMCGTWHWHIRHLDEAEDWFFKHLKSVGLPTPVVQVDRVVMAACSHFNISQEMLYVRDRRFRPVVRARQVIAYILHERMGMSWPSIARVLQRQDHTTAMQAGKTAAKLIAGDVQFAEEVESIVKLADL